MRRSVLIHCLFLSLLPAFIFSQEVGIYGLERGEKLDFRDVGLRDTFQLIRVSNKDTLFAFLIREEVDENVVPAVPILESNISDQIQDANQEGTPINEATVDSVRILFSNYSPLIVAGFEGETGIVFLADEIRNDIVVYRRSQFVKDENPLKPPVLYQASFVINNRNHLYRLRGTGEEHSIEICKQGDNLEEVCKYSSFPLTMEYDCASLFLPLFTSVTMALYAGTSSLGDVNNWLSSEGGVAEIMKFCYEGKGKLRQVAVDQNLSSLKNNFVDQLDQLKQEEAGAVIIKDSVWVGYGIRDPSRKIDSKKCNCLRDSILRKESRYLKDSVKIQGFDENTTQLQSSLSKLNKLKVEYDERCSEPPHIQKFSTNKLKFKPSGLWMRTDFYRFSDIRLTGTLFKKNETGPDTQVPITVINNKFGFSVNGLIGGDNKLFAITKNDIFIDGQFYSVKFNIGEIIEFLPNKGSWSKFFANADYEINSPKDTILLKKRSINDFVSVTVFSDIFGFIDDQPNNVLQTEVTAYVPLNRWNRGRLNFFPEVVSTLNFSLVNGFGENGKFVRPTFITDGFRIDTMVTATATTFDTTNINIGLVNAVEFLRNTDIDFNLRAKAVSFELKTLSSFFNLELGYRLLRSKVDINPKDDEVTIESRFIHSPELNLSLDIRPDWIMGANLQLGGHYFTSFQAGVPRESEFEINDINGKKFKNRIVLRNELNAYAFISSARRSGIFFRYKAYHGNAKLGVRGKQQYFPSILVGYSTNLAALIKGRG